MKKLTFLIICVVLGLSVFAQNNKKTLTFDDILKWNRITEKMISNDGNIVVYKAEPWKGDPVLSIIDNKGKELKTINSATEAIISFDSKFVIFTIKSTEDEIRELKLKKAKEDEMPLNKLGIYNIKNGMLDTIHNLKSHKVPNKWAGWIAYQTRNEIVKDTSIKEVDEKIKKESNENGFELTVYNPQINTTKQFPFVTDYYFAKEKEVLAFVSTGDDKEFIPGVYLFDLNTQKQTEILTGKSTYKQVSINKSGSLLALLADTTKNKIKNYNMYLWNGQGLAKEIINNNDEGILENWEISVEGGITFSELNNRIFFGTQVIKPEKDTTILDEEIAKLDVWHWNESVLHSQQINTKADDLKKSYLAVYQIKEKKIVQLEKPEYTGISIINKGESDKLLAWSNLPYSVQTMWEGYPEHNDFYLIDINSGKAIMIKKDCRAYPEVSPEGKYLYWYNAIDTSWNTYNVITGKEFKLTTPNKIQIADELNDMPNPPENYGKAGWLNNDEAFLVYDRFDVWKIDPENKYDPINLTINGKQSRINYRIIDFRDYILDEEVEEGIDPTKSIYLTGYNEISRNDGFYKMASVDPSTPTELMSGSYSLSIPLKAKDAEVFVYTKETFDQFPDLLITENDFKKSKSISEVNPQQVDFLWGTKELYSWTSLDGRKLEGLLIKPENFDPNKKYPMIVNFYEKQSQELYYHQIPEAHRSTVDYHYYSSNGYIIFNPDVYYKEGYPGEDAFNCVMPGITQLISEGFVDEKHIAAQGHSWGGYQVAYLATRTNIFAAIESGAPVVNMFSAYGGIRLWSGLNRSFQYEHEQSRIGQSIWESPLRYIENSPIFTVDKIQTPMLIMHNTNDGAVPFSQGIEFFIALRRLKKEAWLLNYNEADHWPLIVRDKYDFQIRMAQFFDHYLKNEPMPKWMKEGIPAVDKNIEMGFELIK
ncbi:MAG: prolyl oligopeptidase family serine peptidase [Bacteroidales bacterium]|nr:prolyl oligopeptidase family serine peptidase [Bacteroidales bacterium]